MKKLCFIFLLTTWSAALWAQQVQDSTKVEVLDEVLVRSVRVEADSPITHSNVPKEELPKKFGSRYPNSFKLSAIRGYYFRCWCWYWLYRNKN